MIATLVGRDSLHMLKVKKKRGLRNLNAACSALKMTRHGRSATVALQKMVNKIHQLL